MVVLENKIPETFNQSLLKLLTAVGSTRSIPEFILVFWSSGVLEFWSSGVLKFTNFLIYHFFDFQNLPGSPKVSTLSFLHFLDFCYFKNSGTVLVFWTVLELFLYLWLIFSYNYQIYFFTSSLLHFFSS